MYTSLPRTLLRPFIAGLLLLVVLTVVVAAYAAYDAIGAAREVNSAQQDLHGVLSGGDLLHVTREQVGGARRKLDDAAQRLHRDRRLLAPVLPVMRAGGWLPFIGGPLGEAPDLLALAQDVAEGGRDLARGVDPLLAETEAPGGPATPAATATPGAGTVAPATAGPAPGARLMRALDAGADDLANGDRLLHRAQAHRARLHPASYRGPFRPVRHQIDLLDSKLGTVLRQADALALLPAAARSLLGFSGPRTYVVLGQDSAELRPTGGFIGSAGLVVLDQGKLSFQEYRSSYDFDGFQVPPLPPPLPLQQYLGVGAWYLRDANWSPDFPTTAAQVLDFVSRSTGVRADGVIGFDSFAVTDLLKALGPLTVAGFSQQVTADNWFDLTTQELFTGADALQGKLGDYHLAKGAGLGAVLQAVLAKVQSAHGHALLAVVDGLRQAASGNHLLLALDDQQPATWARLVGADGAYLPSPDGDVVAPVEANVGYDKVGPYIERSLQYDVWLDADGRPERARLALSFHNAITDAILADPAKRIEGKRFLPDQGAFLPSPGVYSNYLRIYVPGDSTAQTASGLNTVVTMTAESSYHVLAGLLVLAPQASATATYDYTPQYAPLAAGEYQLTLIKQPGVAELPVKVAVHLAAGTTMQSLPAGARQEGDAVLFDLTVDATSRLTLHVQPSAR